MTATMGGGPARLDGPDKLLGRAVYGPDLVRVGMLHGRLLRSLVPHGRIVSIDASVARELPGVRAVLTAADVPDARFGGAVEDVPLLARDRVRYQGEPIALVAAVSSEAAQEALGLIEVQIEELPLVDDPERALEPGAPLIHEAWASYAAWPTVRREGNVCAHTTIERGDLEVAFGAADLVLEERYETAMVHQGYLQPRAALAEATPDGRITVWSTTQLPFLIRENLAAILGLPLGRIRVIATAIGGGFGGKLRVLLEPYCALLALRTGRPVRMAMSVEEELIADAPRAASVTYVRSAAAKDGRILGRRVRVIFDCGAYAGSGPGNTSVGALVALGPYDLPAVRVDAYGVYTNKANTGSYRAPGGPEVNFAIESHTDEIAHRLGLDPLEVRLRNLLEEGGQAANGQVVRSVSIREVLTRAAEAIGWGEGVRAREPIRSAQGRLSERASAEPLPAGEGRPHTPALSPTGERESLAHSLARSSALPPREAARRGRGLACAWWTTSQGASTAYARANEDGSVVLITGCAEIGTGAVAAGLPRLVAERLGVQPEAVIPVSADTDTTPYDLGAQGSRSLYMAGSAALLAAGDLSARLLRIAADELEASPADLELRDGAARVRGLPERALPIGDLVKIAMRRGGPPQGTGALTGVATGYDDFCVRHSTYPAFHEPSFAAHAAEVEVDVETGQVRVLRYVAAHDVGQSFDRTGIEGQIGGGVAQGLGQALTEQIAMADGLVLNPNLAGYRMPSAVNVPRVECLLVELPSAQGPRGVKGIGEPPIILPPATLGNAIRNATGARLRGLPMTPERVLSALDEAGRHG